nr:hypothetical protein CFP56_72492 [Quercus suber]
MLIGSRLTLRVSAESIDFGQCPSNTSKNHGNTRGRSASDNACVIATPQTLTSMSPSDMPTLPKATMSTPDLFTLVYSEIDSAKRTRSAPHLSSSRNERSRVSANDGERTIVRAELDAPLKGPVDSECRGEAFEGQNCALTRNNDLAAKASPVHRTKPQASVAEDRQYTFPQSVNLHLHTMNISQRLRPMSQLSDSINPGPDVNCLANRSWSSCLQNVPTVCRSLGSDPFSGVAGKDMAEAVNRVKSPTQTSSIYSRPSSGPRDRWPLLDSATGGEVDEPSNHAQMQQQSCVGQDQPSERTETFGSVRWLRRSTRTVFFIRQK